MNMNTNVVGKPLCRVMMAVAIMLLSLQAMAYDFSYTHQGKTLYYDITFSNSVKVADCDTTVNGEVVIPSSLEYNGTTYSVTSIGDSAFYGCSGLTSITIPNSVTSIQFGAFYGCSGLISITIPNSVTTIYGSAFSYCSGLTSVTIPNSVSYIGGSAFSYCSGLTSVTIPNSVTYIGRYAFSHCSGLTSIDVASGNTHYSSIDGVLYNYAQDTLIQCPGAKTSVTIPNSVTSIGSWAFSYCSGLTSVTIPNSVTSIERSAFSYCSGLTSVTIPNSVTSIGNGAFYYCSGLTSVTIPNSVSYIEDWAFSYCSGLTSVTIPNSVTSIVRKTFEGCSGLTSITIPNSVTSIGDNAFNGCSGLTSVLIGNSLTSINERAFYGCTSLSYLVSLATIPPTIGNEAFPYPNTCTVTVPCGSLAAYTTPTCLWNIFFPQRITESLSFELSVSANDEAYGRVEVETQSCEVATITATPNEGYEFTAWSDGNMENPKTVSLTSDTAFMAIFTEAVSTPTVNTLAASNITHEAATLNGTITAGSEAITAQGFMYKASSATDWTTVAATGTTLSATVNNLTAETAYEYKAFATTASGTIEGAVESFTTLAASGLADAESGAIKAMIYPNPAKDKATLSLTGLTANAKIIVSDLQGRIIQTEDLQAGTETYKLNTSNYASGVYYIRILCGNNSNTQKLVIE